ncbi:MAG TPA: hypothetical protein VFS13_05910 [Steroidobacteraceae bacterium]|jgi:hypothetical protein|nr:hypothetical protein [Steroidobacteraceae bacterium]
MAKVRLSAEVEVREPRLRLSGALRYLDLDALARTGRAEVAIGEIDGGCCQHTVFASVRRGKVVDVYPEECPRQERVKLSKPDARLIAQAIQRTRARRRGRHRLPLPVRSFFGSSAVARAVTVETLTCVRICILGACITCCRRTDIPNGDLMCGHVTIDTTKPS